MGRAEAGLGDRSGPDRVDTILRTVVEGTVSFALVKDDEEGSP